MKTNIFLFALLGMVVSISACKDDDGDGNPTVEDSFTYNNQTYEVNSGAILDYGPIGLTNEEDTHYAYAFLVSDGTMSFPQDEDPTLSDATYVLTTFLYSKNTSNFSGGTFEWVNPATATADDVLGKDVMLFAMLSVDSNNDGDVEDNEDLDYNVTEGNVVVDGSGTNFSITYDLTFNSQRLQGNYEGPFTIIDGTNLGGSNGEGAFTYMEEELIANSGLIRDFGETDIDNNGTEDFYNKDFYITDALFSGDGEDVTLEGEFTYMVYAELLAPLGDSFQTGTFEFVPPGESVSTDQHVFYTADIEIDLNGDGDTEDEDEFAFATGGFITISGDDRTYDIMFNLELDNGETLIGGYSGNFSYANANEGERRGQLRTQNNWFKTLKDNSPTKKQLTIVRK